MLEELKGINKEREEKGREKSTVEYLLETCNEVIQEYKTKITNNYNKMQEVYQAMYKKIEKKLPEYNEKDLTSLIFTKANNEHDKKESTALGLYTGILLHILTKRNQKKGKKTQFYINGKGNKFDYLFYFAKEVDELTIESFTGDNICECIASYEGKANKITLNNNKGNYTAWYAGSDQGNINTLIINNNKGNDAAIFAGYDEGNINKIIINNITGENIARGAKAKQIITEKEALQEYQEIIQLLNSFKNKTPEEMIAITEEITKCLKT